MARKYVIHDQQGIHFVTFTVVYWIDLFIRAEYKEIIIDSLKYCQKEKGLVVHAYCMMTSHVHLILSTESEEGLSKIIRDLKSHTSRALRAAITHHNSESRKEWVLWMMERAGKKNKRNSDFQFWQQHNHPILLDTNELLEQRLNYVHDNPVEAGFVSEPGDWLWSSARQYEGEQGFLEIQFIE